MKTIYEVNGKMFTTKKDAQEFVKSSRRYDTVINELQVIAKKFSGNGNCDCSKYCDKGLICPSDEWENTCNTLQRQMLTPEIKEHVVNENVGEAML